MPVYALGDTWDIARSAGINAWDGLLAARRDALAAASRAPARLHRRRRARWTAVRVRGAQPLALRDASRGSAPRPIRPAGPRGSPSRPAAHVRGVTRRRHLDAPAEVAQPGALLAREAARGPGDRPRSAASRSSSPRTSRHDLRVAQGLGRGRSQAAAREQAAHLVLPAGLEHRARARPRCARRAASGSSVSATMPQRTRAARPPTGSATRTAGARSGGQASSARTTRLLVVGVQARRAGGVDARQLGVQRRRAALVERALELRAQRRVGRGPLEQARGQGLEVEGRTAHEEQPRAARARAAARAASAAASQSGTPNGLARLDQVDARGDARARAPPAWAWPCRRPCRGRPASSPSSTPRSPGARRPRATAPSCRWRSGPASTHRGSSRVCAVYIHAASRARRGRGS